MKRNKVNRKRDKAVLIRMNESEYATLNEKLKQTGATQQAFIISAIKEAMILSVDGLRSMKDISKDFANLLRQVQGLANNVNQLAHWANQTGLVPEIEELIRISGQIEKYRKECEEIWQSIRSLTTQQKPITQCEPSCDMSSKTEKAKKAM